MAGNEAILGINRHHFLTHANNASASPYQVCFVIHGNISTALFCRQMLQHGRLSYLSRTSYKSISFPDFHRQGNPFFRRVHGKHLNVHDIAYAHGLHRMLDKPIRDLGNMDQPVLMDADIDKRAEINDIAYGRSEERREGKECRSR